MIAFTTGTALVLTRAMLRCSGHTSPLIWEQCENIWSVLMLPVLVEYLLRNWVAFITFKTTPNFTRWASMTFSFVKAYGCINWRHLSENCWVPCCPFALTLMWKWPMYLRTLGNISFYDTLFHYLMTTLYASFPKISLVSPNEPLRIHPRYGQSFRHRKASLHLLRCAQGCTIDTGIPVAVPPILT